MHSSYLGLLVLLRGCLFGFGGSMGFVLVLNSSVHRCLLFLMELTYRSTMLKTIERQRGNDVLGLTLDIATNTGLL